MSDQSLQFLIPDAGSILPRVSCFTILDTLSWPTNALLHAEPSGDFLKVTKLEEGKYERWVKKASHSQKSQRKKGGP